MEILRFTNMKNYKEWLSWQSGNTKDKAYKYEKKYPGTIPIVLIVDIDEGNCPDGAVHIFVPPHLMDELEKLIDQAIWDPE